MWSEIKCTVKLFTSICQGWKPCMLLITLSQLFSHLSRDESIFPVCSSVIYISYFKYCCLRRTLFLLECYTFLFLPIYMTKSEGTNQALIKIQKKYIQPAIANKTPWLFKNTFHTFDTVTSTSKLTCVLTSALRREKVLENYRTLE